MFGFIVENPLAGIVTFTAALMFIVTLIYKKMVDQAVVSESKAEIKDLQEKIKKAQKDGDMEKVNKLMSIVLQHNTNLMKQMFKPMLVSFALFIILVPFLSGAFAEGGIYYGKKVLMIPGIGDIGWFWTYLILAILFSIIFRKLLGVKL